ncbi:hypothetical protein TNCV_2450681 [Trichonephila clavipes]|nr:hypothetical protein TNCV_2450681 [Trichonephila clavipes]
MGEGQRLNEPGMDITDQDFENGSRRHLRSWSVIHQYSKEQEKERVRGVNRFRGLTRQQDADDNLFSREVLRRRFH